MSGVPVYTYRDMIIFWGDNEYFAGPENNPVYKHATMYGSSREVVEQMIDRWHNEHPHERVNIKQ